MTSMLPAGFERLEFFVDRWAVAGTANRDRRRSESTEDERVAFFEAAKGLVPKALELLDARPLDALDEREQRLLDLMLSFAHVTMAVEMLGKAEERHARFRAAMRITRSPADA
ncbi:MAG: hypothetical protein WCY11_15245 [Novosphingobium sp.]